MSVPAHIVADRAYADRHNDSIAYVHARREANNRRTTTFDSWTTFIGYDEHGTPHRDCTLNTRISPQDMRAFTPGFINPPLFLSRS